MLPEGKIFYTLTQKDSSTLATGLRLGNHNSVLFLLHELPQIVVLRGKDPSFRIEVIIVRKGLGHFN